MDLMDAVLRDKELGAALLVENYAQMRSTDEQDVV